MRNVHQINKGFTLVEFLVAIVIIAVGLLGMLMAVTNSMSYNVESQMRDEAVRLADDAMYTLKSRPFDAISSSHNSNVQATLRQGTVNYAVTQTVSQPYSTLNTKNIQMDITWTYKGKSYVHTLSTLVSKTIQ